MQDSPIKHRGFLLIIALVGLGTVPFVFVGREYTAILGLPAWLWFSSFFTVALAVLTAWGILRYWKDDRFE